jgi:uncharacterized cupredoxin-like copper-binding protein
MNLRALGIAAAITLPASIAGCGGGDNGDVKSTPASTTKAATPSNASGTTTIRMNEFSFAPNNVALDAGTVTIIAPNDGKTEHELVLLKTSANAASLPMKGGHVDESTSVGEIADVTPQATKRHTFKLTPGHYVMVCALPGHYESGMYGTLTVR